MVSLFNKKRIRYFIGFLMVLFIEIFIALFVRDQFIRPYVGDILVVVVIYLLIRIFIPNGVKLLSLYIFLFAAAVEIMQYFHLVELLGVEDHAFFRILIGSVFDVKDIVCYGVGCILIEILVWISKVKGGNGTDTSII